MRTNIVPNEIIKIVTFSDKTYLDQLITTSVVIYHDISVISLKISVNYYFQQKSKQGKKCCPALSCRAARAGLKKNISPCPGGQGRAGLQGSRAALPCDGLWYEPYLRLNVVQVKILVNIHLILRRI